MYGVYLYTYIHPPQLPKFKWIQMHPIHSVVWGKIMFSLKTSIDSIGGQALMFLVLRQLKFMIIFDG